jgi:hypothetical protein
MLPNATGGKVQILVSTCRGVVFGFRRGSKHAAGPEIRGRGGEGGMAHPSHWSSSNPADLSRTLLIAEFAALHANLSLPIGNAQVGCDLT